MSSHVESHVPPRPSLFARAKERLVKALREPNPIWVRELKQSIRRGHTPVALMLLTVLMTLLLTATGGTISSFRSPASTGRTLYQTFFSIAYFVVLLLGPALAANSIVSEREGRTWEAVLLTGMRPSQIAGGKFLSALTAIGLFIVALAPVGALPFLFGGVTATDVLFAFFYLLAFAILSVSFGLAISSKMQRLGTAIVVTLLLAVVIAFVGFGTFGLGLSFVASELWPRLSEGHPVWLPMAYARAGFDLDYLLFLVLFPVVGFTVPAWFSYEATVANLTTSGDDRSSGLKRWFVFSAAALCLLGVILPIRAKASTHATVFVVLGLYAGFLAFSAFVFQGEPIGPSRRIRAEWERSRASRLRRFLGPGLIPTFQLVLGGGLLGLSLLTASGYLIASSRTGWFGTADDLRLLLFAAYAAAFFIFLAGLVAHMRARSKSASAARITTLILFFAILVAPWLLAATVGAFSDEKSGLLLAAPSPFYVFVMLDAVGSSAAPTSHIVAGLVATVAWAAIGIVCFFTASSRVRKTIQEHEALLRETDALLDAEDRAHAEALAQSEGSAAEGSPG